MKDSEKYLVEHSSKYHYSVYFAENQSSKLFTSNTANYIFNLKSGRMISWGKTLEDEPGRYPINTILDLEITTVCAGPPTGPCKFCYKANNPRGKHMSFETFKKIFDVQSKGLTQIAFGSDYTGVANPDVFKMMDYAREHSVIPNITVGYVSDKTADEFAKRVGAIAISLYDKEQCYDSVKRMTDRGVSQANIHVMICEETYERALQLIEDAAVDPRLENLNAIVLLSLKQKGRGKTGFTPLSQEKFNKLCTRARELHVGIGMDSCSSLKTFEAFGNEVADSITPCESGRESSYINVDGMYFPCSFTEGEVREDMDWSTGLNVLECKDTEDFLDKIWNNERTLNFYNKLESTCTKNKFKCRECPLFNV